MSFIFKTLDKYFLKKIDNLYKLRERIIMKIIYHYYLNKLNQFDNCNDKRPHYFSSERFHWSWNLPTSFRSPERPALVVASVDLRSHLVPVVVDAIFATNHRSIRRFLQQIKFRFKLSVISLLFMYESNNSIFQYKCVSIIRSCD